MVLLSLFVRKISTGALTKYLQKNQKYTDIHVDFRGV